MVKLYEHCGISIFLSHKFTAFCDLHNNIFSRMFIALFFADSSTNTAIFDFVETTFCTMFFKFQQLCETQW